MKYLYARFALQVVNSNTAVRPLDHLLTGRQVKHDANWGSVVDNVRPLVQVVHIIAAVIATVTKHQLQHQVLWGSQKRPTESQKGQHYDN